MTIKRRDGSVYKLANAEPTNPILENQNEWSDYVAHNLTYQEVTYQVDGKQIPLPFLPEEVTEEIVIELDPAESLDMPQSLTRCFVLPTVLRTEEDSLYGDKITRWVYGEKYIADVAIREIQAGLLAEFWTKDNLQRGSILFFPSERQWWKVSGSIRDNDGFVIKTMVSDQNPSFL